MGFKPRCDGRPFAVPVDLVVTVLLLQTWYGMYRHGPRAVRWATFIQDVMSTRTGDPAVNWLAVAMHSVSVSFR